MGSSTGKNYLFTFYYHPVLVRFLSCKMCMRYICSPYLIPAFWPLDWNLLLSWTRQDIKSFKYGIFKNIMNFLNSIQAVSMRKLPYSLEEGESSNYNASQALDSVAHNVPSKSDQALILFGIWDFCLDRESARNVDHHKPWKLKIKE
jgi:hypothetical protein